MDPKYWGFATIATDKYLSDKNVAGATGSAI